MTACWVNSDLILFYYSAQSCLSWRRDKTGPSFYSHRHLGSQGGADAVFDGCVYIRSARLRLCELRACVSLPLGVCAGSLISNSHITSDKSEAALETAHCQINSLNTSTNTCACVCILMQYLFLLKCVPSSGGCQLTSRYSPGNYGPASYLLPHLSLAPRLLNHTPSPVLPLPPFSNSLPWVSETCCKLTDNAEADRHSYIYRHTLLLEILSANMGQILSWIRGPRDSPTLQDVAVEEQVCSDLCMSMPVCSTYAIQKYPCVFWFVSLSQS